MTAARGYDPDRASHRLNDFRHGGFGGADGIRTHDLDGANVALSQLSYGPSRPAPAGFRTALPAGNQVAELRR